LKVFIDTWGWITLTNKREQRHEEVQNFYRTLRAGKGVLYTTNDVLNETFTLLFRRLSLKQAFLSLDIIEEAIKINYLIVVWITEERFEKAKELRHKFSDKPLISFTDLTSIVVMQELDISEVLTEDNHFMQVGMGFRKVPEKLI